MTRPAKESRSSLPILLLSAAGFTILTTEFVIVGLLPSMAKDLKVSVSQAGLLVTLFAFTVAVAGPLLTASLVNRARKRLFVFVLLAICSFERTGGGGSEHRSHGIGTFHPGSDASRFLVVG